jgi:hypothetical protein
MRGTRSDSSIDIYGKMPGSSLASRGFFSFDGQWMACLRDPNRLLEGVKSENNGFPL